MNQKQCPKCGESNPAEAVMCWACYTPLSGGAPVAAGAGGGAIATSGTAVAKDDGDKKPISPVQIGVVAVALLIGIGFGVTQMMGGGSSATEESGGIIINNNGGSNDPAPGNPAPGPAAPAAVLDPGGGGGEAVGPVQAPYTLVTPPNPTQKWGVMALVPTDPSTSATRAAGLAAFARGQFKSIRGWNGMQIFVFRDQRTGQAFNTFQSRRRGASLGPAEYQQLITLWSSCLAYYEVRGNRAMSPVYPSQNPTSWWTRNR